MFFKLLSGLNRSGQFGKQVKHFGAVPAAFEIAVVPFSNLGVVPDTVKRIDDPALCFERNRNFMLTKELHNERFAVDLPVYHLLSRHNISFGLTDGGIVTGLSFLCQLLFTDFLLRPPFISLPLPFRSNGGIVGFCFLIPSKQIGKSQISPPVRGFHTLIENPLDLTPDAMLQRGQPFQDFLKPVPLVNAHHKPVTWNINCLEELPFLLHCVEFNAIRNGSLESLGEDRTRLILDKALSWTAQNYAGWDLYRHLRDELGMSNEEIGKAGFDLDEFYEVEAADSAEYEVEADYGEEL